MKFPYRQISVVILLACLSPVARGAAPSAADAKRDAVAAAVRAGMEEHGVPGVSIALIDDYKIVWAQGFGVLAEGGEAPVTPETRFQAASISKPITALAVLRLVEEQKLSLDEPVNGKLKSWQIPEVPATKRTPIALRHLLSHYAGLSVHGFQGYAAGEKVPSLLEVLDGKPPANSQAVRSMLRPEYALKYSGGGYCIVQQLLIDVTGEAFPQLMQELVLEPAGMAHSTYEQPLPKSLAPEAATGHRAKRVPIEGHCHVYPEMAAAGLWTTPSDLSLAAIDVAKSYEGRGGVLLSESMARRMLTPVNKAFGLGFIVQGEGKQLSFSHGGANEGYRCQLTAYPATGQGLVIMTNSDSGGAMLGDVIKTAMEAYGWPAEQVPQD
jgi:CubicO group peptidase (beta-lactamase class C family)